MSHSTPNPNSNPLHPSDASAIKQQAIASSQTTQQEPLLLTALPKAVRLKKSILVAFMLTVLCIGCILFTFLPSSPQIVQESLDEEGDQHQWLASKSMQAQPAKPPVVSVAGNPGVVTAATNNTSLDRRCQQAVQRMETTAQESSRSAHSSEMHAVSEKRAGNDEDAEASWEEFVKIAKRSPIQVNAHAQASAQETQPAEPATQNSIGDRIPAGTLIPLILITQLNSELPGFVQAQVLRDVHDLHANNKCLIPKGTKVILHYESAHADQARLALKGIVMVLQGKSIALDGIPVIDQQGQTGLHDQVNHHLGHNLFSTLLHASNQYAEQLPSLLAAMNQNNANLVQPMMPVGYGNPAESKAPTFTVRAGFIFNLLVVQDVDLPV